MRMRIIMNTLAPTPSRGLSLIEVKRALRFAKTVVLFSDSDVTYLEGMAGHPVCVYVCVCVCV